jgi:diguanylate cyclase (GGDEF)-like protein/PAS domain S-box-containing protein
MLDWLQSLTNDPGFMPHGHCFLWTPALLNLYLLGDGLIASAYFSIPLALWYYARRRHDLPYRWLVLLFAAFIISCGLTHLLQIWNIWNHAYWLEGWLMLATGLISIVCAIALWPIIPRALALPSHEQLRVAHASLLQRHEQLMESEARYRQLIETAEEGIWVIDRGGIITSANASLATMLGCPEGIVGRAALDFVFDDDRAQALRQREDWIEDGVPNRFSFRLRRADGEAVNVLVSASSLRDKDGASNGALVLITDVSELVRVGQELEELNKQLEARVDERTRALEASNTELAHEVVKREYTEQELRASNERLNRYLRELERHNEEVTRLNQLSDQLHCSDSTNELLKVLERSCSELFGCEGGALLTWHDDDLSVVGAPWGAGASRNWQLSSEALQALRHGRLSPSREERGPIAAVPAEDGWQLLCAPLQSRGNGVGVLAQLRATPFWQGEAVTDAKQEQMLRAMADHTALALNNLSLREQLREQSLSDPLTGLYNRRYLYQHMDRLVAAWARTGQSFGLILIDIDYFKSFNDRFGHDVGDEVLVSLAGMLQSQVRRSDVACRLGGEEFVVLLAGAELKQALARAEAVRTAASAIRVHGAGDSVVTISAGVALFPEHGEEVYSLLRAADRALYESKREGRDRVTLARNEST